MLVRYCDFQKMTGTPSFHISPCGTFLKRIVVRPILKLLAMLVIMLYGAGDWLDVLGAIGPNWSKCPRSNCPTGVPAVCWLRTFWSFSNKTLFQYVRLIVMKRVAREEEWTNWLRLALAGDVQAYNRFLVSVTPYLRSVARHRCDQYGAPQSEAEDVVQEVLLAIHLKRGTWDSSRPLGPWLSAIVRNKLVDSLRRRGRHENVPIDDVSDLLEGADGTHEAADRLDTETMLTRLKDPQRDIVRSISIEGQGTRETAARLKMTEVAVRVALHRALKTLAALYRSERHEDR